MRAMSRRSAPAAISFMTPPGRSMPISFRDDVTYIGVPLARLCNENFQGARERILMKNIATRRRPHRTAQYRWRRCRGAARREVRPQESVCANRTRKPSQLGRDYVRENFPCPLPFHLEKMDANDDKILIDGNTAAALGCVYAGATVAAWYPITPSTSVMDAFKAFCEQLPQRQGNRREQLHLILQAEDELAAIGMVIGASWNGARAFTSTAGPGISLMNELLGLAYYAEIPAVVIDVQRVGPSTGMPTRTQQGDILECAYASHGDTKHILLFPANPSECFEFAVKSFDLAERSRRPSSCCPISISA